MTRFLKYGLLLLALILVPRLALAAEDAALDVLTPQKGHSFFGKFVAATNQEVTFVTDAGPTLTLQWSEVKELEIKRKTTIRGKKALSKGNNLRFLDLDAATIQTDANKLLVASSGRQLGVSRDDLESISSVATDSTANPSQTVWTGSVTGKGSLTSGMQSQQTLGAQIYVRRAQNPNDTDWRHQVSTLILEANNSLTKQVGTPSIRQDTYDGSFKHQVYLWKGLYTDVVADGYHNSSLNLYLEQSYGGGFGKNLYRDERNTLEASANFLYIAEHFYGNVPSVDFTGIRLREGYSYTITYINDTPLTLAETLSYTPALNQRNAWQIRGLVTLNVPITKTFSTTLSFFDNYLQNAPNARKNYSSSSIGITYTIPPPK